MIAHYEDKKRNTFFSQLINIKQNGSMVEHIEDFQKFNIRVIDIPEEHRVDVFIGNLNYNVQHEVCIWEFDTLEKEFRVSRKDESKIMATRKSTTRNYKVGSVVSPSLPQPTRLAPQKLEEKGEKWIFYSCNSKSTKGHKYSEKKLFYIDVKRKKKMNKKMIYTRNQP